MRGLSSLYKGLSGVEPTADDIGAVKKAGDTMTGALILSGSPTDPNQAATKSYVDSNSPSNPVTVPQGGTGLTTLTTAYGVVCAGTTANGSLQNAGAGTSGQYLKSNGASSLPSFASFTPPTIQKFTSGSGTYTTPAGALYLKVRMTGGGGGGGGSGLTSGTGGTGGNSTFGTSLLTANGGVGGIFNAQGGSGGSPTVSSPAISILDIAGSNGGTGEQARTFAFGGCGGSNPISGVAPMSNNIAGFSGKLGGGGGGGSGGATAVITGSGGGAGAYIEAIILNPSATYSYAVASGGAGGTAGTSGFAGGAGGNAFIEITEYYN